MGAELTARDGAASHGDSPRPHIERIARPRHDCPVEADIPTPPWLDGATAALVRAITAGVACRHSDLRAVILYGSVARRDERPLGDPKPSDVDLLLLFDLEPELSRIPYERRLAIFHSIERAHRRHLDAPREVNASPVVRDLADWDAAFVENVARDGLLLWARGPLPAPLAAISGRMLNVERQDTAATA
jgi:predicted nucleotidyltransferase